MKILLSFDIEEFDLPLECNGFIGPEEQIAISQQGLEKVIALLDRYQVKATFFSTAHFAEKVPNLIRSLVKKGHEIASHGHYHDRFETEHLSSSKELLEKLTGQPVTGFRMARMMPFDESELIRAGYRYNSSLHPTLMPGRYNHLDKPRTWFIENSLLQLPASVSPFLRLPLFWLALHLYPLWFYKRLLRKTVEKDQYAVIYFHPWEFSDALGKPKYKIPFYIRHHSGDLLLQRLENILLFCRQEGYHFVRHFDLVEQVLKKEK